MPATASPSSPPGGATDGDPSPPRPGNGRGDEPPASTELEEPDFPYGGFTWVELGILVGLCGMLALIVFLSNFNSPCCAPSTYAETMRSGGRTLLSTLRWGLFAVFTFWACVKLRPRSLGWGPVIGGHLLLAFSVSFLSVLGSDAINMAMMALWPPPNPPDSFTFEPVEVLTDLEFVGALAPYLLLLAVGLGRFRYLRSQAQEEQARQFKRETERLQGQLTAARLKSLRMQINPHFFHNTLHTISTMAGRNPDGIRTATARLSDLMRYVLSTSDQQEVSLDEELDVLESYLAIQKLRLQDRLAVSMDIDPAARTALVPTLLLQPLAENAVKHGFEGSDETGHLRIRAAQEDETLVLDVADDGKGFSDNAAQPTEMEDPSDLQTNEDSHGLENIAERLDGLYGDAASLQFEHPQDGGLRIVIRLPFRTRDPERNLRTSGVVAE